MHEVIEVFPCKTPVLREYYPKVGTLMRTSALSLFYPPQVKRETRWSQCGTRTA